MQIFLISTRSRINLRFELGLRLKKLAQLTVTFIVLYEDHLLETRPRFFSIVQDPRVKFYTLPKRHGTVSTEQTKPLREEHPQSTKVDK